MFSSILGGGVSPHHLEVEFLLVLRILVGVRVLPVLFFPTACMQEALTCSKRHARALGCTFAFVSSLLPGTPWLWAHVTVVASAIRTKYVPLHLRLCDMCH